MDLEKRAMRQSLRVIISEIIMVITVIITVIILALLVSGYWLNGNFEVERQGMLQIHSIPTGANVEVDGDSPWFQRTNTSKVLSSGEHKIVLTREGYDTWEKTVNISEGLLYRVNYPRLFLKERKKSPYFDVSAVTFATISPDNNYILLTNNTTNWTLLKLDSDEPKTTSVDIATFTDFASIATGAKTGLFTGEIVSASWDSACEHVLLKLKNDSAIEWLLVNVKNSAKSLNLTREFALSFDKIRIFDNSTGNLLALKDGNLRKIDVAGRQISSILASGVINFDFYDSEIIYSTNDAVEIMKIGDTEPTILTAVDAPVKPYISRFYDDKYITLVSGDTVQLYKKDDFSEVLTDTISFIPSSTKIGHDGNFVLFQADNNVAVLDMEIMSVAEWQLDSVDSGWLDGSMLYSVKDGELIVYDFDGLNRRELSTGVSPRHPITITSNKWLYYFSDNQIVREIIVQ